MRNIFLQADYNTSSVSFNSTSPINTSPFDANFNQEREKKPSKRFPLFPILFIVLFVGVITFITFKSFRTASPTTVAGAQTKKEIDDKNEIKKPLLTQEINKTFTFPLKSQTEKTTGKFTYTVLNVELRDQVIIKGQTATAIPEKKFLVINLKITNNYNKAITLNSRDFLRVVINASPEKLAADIHNDPLEVQAISTKYTRVGLAINKTDKNVMLQIGDINGKKELIKLTL